MKCTLHCNGDKTAEVHFHVAHTFFKLYLIPTDPPDGSPSCFMESALNYTALRLVCSWSGGFPFPSLQWTGDLKHVIQEQADTGQTNPLTKSAILLPSEGLASSNSLFTCRGSHVALKESTTCSTRACEIRERRIFKLQGTNS